MYIYDIHSAKLIKCLTGQSGEVTAVRVTDKDDFLLPAGWLFVYSARLPKINNLLQVEIELCFIHSGVTII